MVGSLLSRLSAILSQMMSTSRSNVCFTFMLSLALVSKNSKPAKGETEAGVTFIVPVRGAYPVNLLISSWQDTSELRLYRRHKPHPFSSVCILTWNVFIHLENNSLYIWRAHDNSVTGGLNSSLTKDKLKVIFSSPFNTSSEPLLCLPVSCSLFFPQELKRYISWLIWILKTKKTEWEEHCHYSRLLQVILQTQHEVQGGVHIFMHVSHL